MRVKVCAALSALLLGLSIAFGAFAAIRVDASKWPVEKNGYYSTMEEVSVYLAQYGRLPGNYLTKRDAQALGWDNSRGNLWQVAYGCSIGGDRYGNYEGRVPDARGRSWKECDIDYDGGYRGPKRIVFSSDGLIYYTGNHYKSFDEVNVVFPAAEAGTKEPKQETAGGKRPLIAKAKVTYGECYTGWQEVAAYLLAYRELPVNYITMEEAKELGFSSKKDNMGEVAPEFAIGGGSFANREGLLPQAQGRSWTECDVDMKAGGKRGKHRLIWSNDGLIYLTRDKYKSFVQVKGE